MPVLPTEIRLAAGGGEMTELKPCPFCGNQPEQIVESGPDDGFDEYTISCDCISGIEVYGRQADGESEESIIAKWNTRPVEDRLHRSIALMVIDRGDLRERNDRLVKGLLKLADIIGPHCRTATLMKDCPKKDTCLLKYVTRTQKKDKLKIRACWLKYALRPEA